ncbi:hypothetical protein [Burkholderia lata]|uniref:hypothetical protein n=1 Tax=Burkholderia lata (strain ATCC 17760 / DSM 23089 / LMG 22485 / NCIMB 9086 / R18194 / 383) TaxID=482957 RepID=UPI001581FEA9|nr:hypothetical protein [Burkholderia lata]
MRTTAAGCAISGSLVEWRASRVHAEATGKLGQPKQQLHARLMTTLSPDAFAGHTPMMQQYLRLI